MYVRRAQSSINTILCSRAGLVCAVVRFVTAAVWQAKNMNHQQGSGGTNQEMKNISGKTKRWVWP